MFDTTQDVHALNIAVKKAKSDLAAIDTNELVLYQINLDEFMKKLLRKSGKTYPGT